jgi:hypothetical protein
MKNLFVLTGFCITLLILSSCSKKLDSDVTSTQVPPPTVASTVVPTVAPSQVPSVSPKLSDIEITSPANNDNANTDSNPINAYLTPRINDQANCEAEMREYQDTYRGVWKAEFENIMNWMITLKNIMNNFNYAINEF